jgi:tetratricopeptide (TPR) repeat protein
LRRSQLAFLPFAAALLVAPSLAFAQPSEADRAEARRQFQTGVQQFQQRSFAPALEAFQSAYRIAPHPSVRKNMAFCLQELGRDGEALEQFELYLAEAQAVAPAERRTIDQRIRTLRGRLAEVTLTVTPADALSLVVTVDGRVVSTARPVRLSAGHHQIQVAATGYAALTREIDTTAGQPQSLTLTLEQEAPPPPPPSAAAAAAASAAAA